MAQNGIKKDYNLHEIISLFREIFSFAIFKFKYY